LKDEVKVRYVFSMVILSEFRMRQYRNDDHWEDAVHFTFWPTLFQELFNNEFSPLRTKLKFGKLESELCVHPRPPGIQSNRDIFEILGIVNISDLAHPPLESRHLVQAEAENPDEPHLVVLLHRALLHATEE